MLALNDDGPVSVVDAEVVEVAVALLFITDEAALDDDDDDDDEDDAVALELRQAIFRYTSVVITVIRAPLLMDISPVDKPV